MSYFAELLQGLIVLLIVSGAIALLLQRIYKFAMGTSSNGCSSGCGSCPSRCHNPHDSTAEDSIQVVTISKLRKPT